MQPIKHVLCTLLLCVTTAVAFAADVDDIDVRANFANYWSAMSHKDYKGATAYVHPLDLAGLRTQILPIFLQAGDVPSDSVRAVVEMFFQNVPKNQRGQLSGPELFVLLAEMQAQVDPDTMQKYDEMYDTIKPEIVAIKIEPPNKANVRFKLKVNLEAKDDEDRATIAAVEREETTQAFGKLNGRWYVRLDVSPMQKAAELRQKMGL